MLDYINPFISIYVHSLFFCPSQGTKVRVAILLQFVRSQFLGILGQENYWVMTFIYQMTKKKGRQIWSAFHYDIIRYII